jgi:hypothetical protein
MLVETIIPQRTLADAVAAVSDHCRRFARIPRSEREVLEAVHDVTSVPMEEITRILGASGGTDYPNDLLIARRGALQEYFGRQFTRYHDRGIALLANTRSQFYSSSSSSSVCHEVANRLDGCGHRTTIVVLGHADDYNAARTSVIDLIRDRDGELLVIIPSPEDSGSWSERTQVTIGGQQVRRPFDYLVPDTITMPVNAGQTVTMRGSNGRPDVPLYTVDSSDTSIVYFHVDPTSNASIFADILKAGIDAGHFGVHTTEESPADEENSAYVRIVAQVARAMQSTGETMETRISRLRSDISSSESSLNSYRDNIAALTRSLADMRSNLRTMERSSLFACIAETRDLLGLADTIAEMGQVSSCDVTTDGSTGIIISATTKRFVMEAQEPGSGDWCDDCESSTCGCYDDRDGEVYRLSLPPMVVRINTTAGSFGDAITIRSTSGGIADHPHINEESGNICWGDAATGLADAWGRRDWVSMMYVICGWASRYNGDSPWRRAEVMHAEGFETGEGPGWKDN